jgi:hypothetical protein
MRADGDVVVEVYAIELVVDTLVDCPVADVELLAADPLLGFSPDCDEVTDGVGVIDAASDELDELASLRSLSFLSASTRPKHRIRIKYEYSKDRIENIVGVSAHWLDIERRRV